MTFSPNENLSINENLQCTKILSFQNYCQLYRIYLLLGALLQKLHRDTQKCAYKCSYAVVDGKGVNVFKTPITDSGKKSKKGLMTLEFEEGHFVTKEEGKGSADKVAILGVALHYVGVVL